MRTAFTELLLKRRAELRMSSRGFAKKIGLDPAFYARIEKGTVVPQEQVLSKIAVGFGIQPGQSEEWHEMKDAADIARGEIPAFALSNEKIAAKLPAFFARIRENEIGSEELYDVFREMLTEQSKMEIE